MNGLDGRLSGISAGKAGVADGLLSQGDNDGV